MVLLKFNKKYEREEEKGRERKFWISATEYRNFCCPKPAVRVWNVRAQMETNCGNTIAEIGKNKFVAIVVMVLPKIRKKKGGCRNLGKN